MDLVIDFLVFLISIFSSVSNKFKGLSFNVQWICVTGMELLGISLIYKYGV